MRLNFLSVSVLIEKPCRRTYENDYICILAQASVCQRHSISLTVSLTIAAMAALHGLPLAVRADLRYPYAAGVPDVLKAAKPVNALKTRFLTQVDEINQVLAKASARPETLLYVPLAGRKSFWTAFFDPLPPRS